MKARINPIAGNNIALNVPSSNKVKKLSGKQQLPELLFITSYPPRECGIATYSHDLVTALNSKFENSFKIKICAIENEFEIHNYSKEVKYILNTQHHKAFESLANIINVDKNIQMVIIQHEFGFFDECKDYFLKFLGDITKIKVLAFHTVLPKVDDEFKTNVQSIVKKIDALIVMTEKSKSILNQEYGIAEEKVSVIAHGTHLVKQVETSSLKAKYGLTGKTILSTFGLLSSGKSIETSIEALPEVIKVNPDVLFLVLGKTHPGITKKEGEKYREFLQERVAALNLQDHVRFVNKYLPLDELLEYLQLTDIYLFTSKDPNQAVSGTFAYAASCGCAIISTPIPHAFEFLSGDSGLIVDFQNPKQLCDAINKLLTDSELRQNIKHNGQHKIIPTAWENSALSHAILFERLSKGAISLHHKKPEYNLDHIKRMTTDFGIIQFSKMSLPDIDSGYTLDDNARALIALCQHFEISQDVGNLKLINIYLDFIEYCQQDDGTFLNYVNYKKLFTTENQDCNLEDSNGRAVWALGYLISASDILPRELRMKAENILEKMMINIELIHSPRAMAFIIKGLCYYNIKHRSKAVRLLIKKLADRLTEMYLHEESKEWQWFEGYLTYANSVLPEALIYAYRETQEEMYQKVAKTTFDFLLTKTFNDRMEIKVICNKNWYQKGTERVQQSEQPIDVAYTIFALGSFYDQFQEPVYKDKMKSAFEWFLGRNHLNQTIYNPCTGGSFDGLEKNNVNLNQGAESSVSYLLARLSVERSQQKFKVKESQVIKLKQEDYEFKVS